MFTNEKKIAFYFVNKAIGSCFKAGLAGAAAALCHGAKNNALATHRIRASFTLPTKVR